MWDGDCNKEGNWTEIEMKSWLDPAEYFCLEKLIFPCWFSQQRNSVVDILQKGWMWFTQCLNFAFSVHSLFTYTLWTWMEMTKQKNLVVCHYTHFYSPNFDWGSPKQNYTLLISLLLMALNVSPLRMMMWIFQHMLQGSNERGVTDKQLLMYSIPTPT